MFAYGREFADLRSFAIKENQNLHLRMLAALQIILLLLRFDFALSQESSLILSDGPPKILEKYPRVISASVGGSVKLACPLERSKKNVDASEFIETIIVWQKNEKVIGLGWERFRIKDDLLNIRDVEESDTGNYTCTATNGFGSVVGYYLLCVTEYEVDPTERSATADFCSSSDVTNHRSGNRDLETDAPLFVKDVLTDMVVETGEPVTLTCQVHSVPAPRVQWFRKLGLEMTSWRKRSDTSSRQVNFPRPFNSSSFFQQAESYQALHSPEYAITTKPSGSNTYLSRLSLRHTTSKDTGIYFCLASNPRGLNYEFASLKVIAQDSNESFLTSSNGNVSWVAAFVVCVFSLVIVILIIVLVRKCRAQKEQKCRTQTQTQTTHQPLPKPQNPFPTIMKAPGDNRTIDFYPQHSMEYNQVDQVEPFLSLRQHPLYPDPICPPPNGQMFHPVQLPFLPSTTSSDKTISSYQSLHQDDRCNQHGVYHGNRNPHMVQWPHNQPGYC